MKDYVMAKLEDMHVDILDIKTAVKEQNGRVRKLEHFKYWCIGGLAVVGVLVSYVLAKIV